MKTEQQYGATLKKIHDFYAMPLKGQTQQGKKSLLDLNDWNLLFRESETVHHVQVAIQKDLVAQWSKFMSLESDADEKAFTVMPIVNVLAKFAPLLRSYKIYIADYQKMRALISDLSKTKRKNAQGQTFLDFLRSQQLQDGCKGDLGFLSIAPVQVSALASTFPRRGFCDHVL
eukprot:SAG31_NODE_373_length_16597_cov_21.519518_17_plen_173_part_00